MPEWKKLLRQELDLTAVRQLRDERMLNELADHLDELYRDAIIRGLTPEEAEAYALERLGDPAVASAELAGSQPVEPGASAAGWMEAREEALRRASSGRLLPLLADRVSDVRLAARALAGQPVFTAVAVLVLALGIGATTTMFTLADAVVLSPLPFEESDRLVNVSHTAPSLGLMDVGQTAAWHLTYEDEGQAFEHIGMYLPRMVTVTGAGDPEAVPALMASSGVFRALRLEPVVGRGFVPDDEAPGAPLEMLIGHDYWRSRFAGDPEVVGKTLRVDGETWQIVGVLPKKLRGLEVTASIVLPIRFDRSRMFVGNIGYGSVARLGPGVTLDQATADLTRLLPSAWERFASRSGFPSADPFSPIVVPLKERLVGPVAQRLWVLFGGVTVVLLIACANVANLFLVRADAKKTEMAVRTAMGASHLRVGWEYVRESLVVGLLGGIAGLALTHATLPLVLTMAGPYVPRLQDVGVDAGALAFVLALSVGTGVLFGLLPAIRHQSTALPAALKQAGRSAGAGGGGRAQDALAVGQIALALVLLVASGLMLRTIQSLSDVDPGFSGEEDLLTLRLTLPPEEVPDLAEAASTFERIARRLEEVPGVTSVAMATRIPMDFTGNLNPFHVDGVEPPGESGSVPTRWHNWLGEGFFETLEIPLVAGRSITWDDVQQRAPVAILSESLAREYWASPEDALGQRVSARSDPERWHEVVGVAADVRYAGVADEPEQMVYWPQVTLGFWNGTTLEQVQTWRAMGYAIRSPRVGMAGFVEDVREAIREISPNVPLRDVLTMPELMAHSVAQTRLVLLLLGAASVASLILGLIGVYGVIAYAVSRRTRELGIRMALGAGRQDVLGMVLRKGLALAVIGTGLGLLLALFTTRLMAGLLFGVGASDPVTLMVVVSGLMGATLAASWLPARRAARVDPLEALRPD